MKVPWISKGLIEAKASEVISGYETMTGYPITPPVPVESIIERHLGLNLSFEDLDRILGMKHVLGATYVELGRICINEHLLEDRSEGRMIFTCAHEVGHWVLHRQYVEKAERFGRPDNAIICRSDGAGYPIEWQADYFAACLLMPREEIRDAFCRVCGAEFLVLDNIRSAFGGMASCIDPCVENWHFIADMVREAGGFTNVSKQAVIIRLQEVGLLINRTGAKIGWQALCSSE